MADTASTVSPDDMRLDSDAPMAPWFFACLNSHRIEEAKVIETAMGESFRDILPSLQVLMDLIVANDNSDVFLEFRFRRRLVLDAVDGPEYDLVMSAKVPLEKITGSKRARPGKPGVPITVRASIHQRRGVGGNRPAILAEGSSQRHLWLHSSPHDLLESCQYVAADVYDDLVDSLGSQTPERIPNEHPAMPMLIA